MISIALDVPVHKLCNTPTADLHTPRSSIFTEAGFVARSVAPCD